MREGLAGKSRYTATLTLKPKELAKTIRYTSATVADRSATLREEVIEELGRHHSAVAGVKEWLEHAAANNPDPKVRTEARQRLNP